MSWVKNKIKAKAKLHYSVEKNFGVSVISFVTYTRPPFQSYEVETLHAAPTREGVGFRPCEAGLSGL